ncbi:MAG: hypothetical protein N3C63_00780 [Rhodocyclaceae bacterium]|nr:hypothetical protein [Rhodocyclaceae bacterium]
MSEHGFAWPLILPIARSSRLARLLCRGEVSALRLHRDGRLALRFPDGHEEEAAVDGSTSVFPRLILLRYRLAGRMHSLLLPRAALGATGHRRLRVWLHTCASASLNVGVA